MSKSKLTLLIDGNWLLISRLSVINNKYLDDFELGQDLKLLLIKSINVVLRTFPLIDNIMFCSDGGSWRSKIELPKCLHHDIEGVNVEYKGTRTKSDDVNWEFIFSIYEEFISILQQNGINTYREKELEGDDWIYFWSKELNKQGTNCIIWTKDNDLKQLINTDKNKCFTIWWNKDAGVFTDEHDEQDFDFLLNYDFNQNEQLYNYIIEKSSKVTKINPKSIVIDKIIKGDQSDNILPIILRKSKTNSEKKFKVSSKDIDFSLDYYNDDKVRNYINHLINQKNYIGRIEDKTEEDIIEHFIYNRKIVALEDNSYPQYVKDIFENHNNYSVSKDTKQVESIIQASANKIKGILDLV